MISALYPFVKMKRLQSNNLRRCFKVIVLFGSICTILVSIRLKNTPDVAFEERRSMLEEYRENLPFGSSNIPHHINRTNVGFLKFQHNITNTNASFNISLFLLNEIRSHITVKRASATAVDRNYTSNNSSDFRTFNVSNLSVVVFSVPPKCGSRTLLLVVNSLKAENGLFREITALVDFNIVQKGSIQQKFNYINNAITKAEKPAFLYTHALYMPYEQEDELHRSGMGESKTVIRISIIRDPFERKVSHYYYSRFRDSEPETNAEHVWRNSMKNIRRESFDECVRLHRLECVAELYKVRLITQFCGYDRGCKKANTIALERAKKNVKNNFLIVGIMEEYEDFMKLLETMLPELFKGSMDKYKSIMKSERKSSMKTNNKVKPENSTIDQVKNMMRFDYEFYDFIKNRFHEQKKMYL